MMLGFEIGRKFWPILFYVLLSSVIPGLSLARDFEASRAEPFIFLPACNHTVALASAFTGNKLRTACSKTKKRASDIGGYFEFGAFSIQPPFHYSISFHLVCRLYLLAPYVRCMLSV
jgi:hypothetical protein